MAVFVAKVEIETLEKGFTAELESGKAAVDEGKGFVSRRELLAYHLKMGR